MECDRGNRIGADSVTAIAAELQMDDTRIHINKNEDTNANTDISTNKINVNVGNIGIEVIRTTQDLLQGFQVRMDFMNTIQQFSQ